MLPDDVRRLRRAFARWAAAEPSVLALAIVGSWAHGTARADSDLDVLILTDRLDRWAEHEAWLRDLLRRAGHPVSSMAAERHGAARGWRAWAGRAVEVEATLASPGWASTAPVDPGTRRVVADGMAVLLDREGALRALREAVRGDPGPEPGGP